MTLPAGSAKLPFDVCFPAHLKRVLRELLGAVQDGDSERFRRYLTESLEFLMRYWTGAALGALERVQPQMIEVPPHPDWSETLRLLRYAVMAWESHPQSSFRTLLRLGFFETGDPPRPRIQCRWLGIAGEWSEETASADRTEVWEGDAPLPGSTARYLELLGEWLRASRPLFVKLTRRYQEQGTNLSVSLEDGRGKQLNLKPALPWRHYAPNWRLAEVVQAESAATLATLPSDPVEPGEGEDWFNESVSDILSQAVPTEILQAEPVPPVPATEPAPAVPPPWLVSDQLARETVEAPQPGPQPLIQQAAEAPDFASPAEPVFDQGVRELQPAADILEEAAALDFQSPEEILEQIEPNPAPPLEESLEPAPEPAPPFEESLEPAPAPAPPFEESLEPAPAPAPPLEESLEPAAEPTPKPGLERRQPSWASDDLDSLLGLDSLRAPSAHRWRPRPLEFPGNLPNGVRGPMESARRALIDYSNLPSEDDAVRQSLARGLLEGLTSLLDLSARVACLGLAQVAPLPEPLRQALQQSLNASQAVKLLHFAWTALQDTPDQFATRLLQAVFFELHAADVPRLHARWLGLPDAPMIGLQHVSIWVRVAEGQLKVTEQEFGVQLRELLDALQLWLVAASPLWAACDLELNIRPDGLWTGGVTLAGERYELDPDTATEEPLELLLGRWRQRCAAQRPPFFVQDEVLEFVESVAAGSGMMLQAPSALGKTFLLRDLKTRQPQVGGFRCAWLPVRSKDPFALEELNSELESLHAAGFPWNALGSAALADLQRHSPRETLFAHYFAALSERNQGHEEAVRLILLEDDVDQPEDLAWCHAPLPQPWLWLATTESELPAAWRVPCPPARLPVTPEDPNHQKLELDILQELLELPKPQLQEISDRAEDDLLVLMLWAGALESGLFTPRDLPLPRETLNWTLIRALEDRVGRNLLLLLSVAPQGLPLEELKEGSWGQSLRQFLQHFAFLAMEQPAGLISLRHPRVSQAVRRLAATEGRELMGQFCQYLLVKLQTNGRLNVPIADLLGWIAAAEAGEAAWTALQSANFRTWKDEQIHLFDSEGQGHRKIQLIGRWLQVLELALQWGREKAPLQLHEPLEEQLWSYSSRALTFRGLGRLPEALLDVEQAIAGFRPLVEQRPELRNGLAAAFNRRSEILREMGRNAQALQDADEAIRIYAEIAGVDPPRWEPLWALALHHRSLIYQELGRLQDAENDLRQALEHYQPYRETLRARMRMDLVQAYLSRASLAARREDGLLSRDDSQRSLELLQRFDEKWTELRVLQARAQTQLAEAYRLLEDEGRALEASDRATLLWRELIAEGRLDLRGVYTQELCRRGQLLFRVGQLEPALEAAQPAVELLLQLVESEGRADLCTPLAEALLLRGRIWQRRGRPESARRDLSLAFHYLTQQSESWQAEGTNPAVNVLVDTVVLLSQLNLQFHQSALAVEQLQTSLRWVQHGMEHTQQENRALLESLLARALEGSDEALEHHQRALDLYNQLVDEQGHYQLLPYLAEAHLARARTYRVLAHDELALRDANQAVELLTFLSEKGGDPGVLRLLPRARFEAGEILGALGETERALQHLRGGLEDLELMEGDLSKAESLLERARALMVQANLLPEDQAVGVYRQALDILAQAREEGAETQRLESEVRRKRAELLLRLGHTAEAVDELLGETAALESEDRLEQVRGLLQKLLEESRELFERQEREAAVSAYNRTIQVGELLHAGDTSGNVVQLLIRAYEERALAGWDPSSPEPTFRDLDRAMATCALYAQAAREYHSLQANLFEARARLFQQLGRVPEALADIGRALQLLRKSSLPRPESAYHLLWLRIELAPTDPGAWGDLQALEMMLKEVHIPGVAVPMERTRVRRSQAEWLDHYGWSEQADLRWTEVLSELKKGLDFVRGAERADRVQELLEILKQRLSRSPNPQFALEWALMLGDNLGPHPELAVDQSLQPVQDWLQGADPTSRERFAQVWLAILAEHPGVPESFFELVPRCVQALQLEEFDADTWASLLDILDKRANDESLTRLTWEGETLIQLLALPRGDVSRHADLEMALADCLRRWADLPPHRLALAGVSGDALGEWLEA